MQTCKMCTAWVERFWKHQNNVIIWLLLLFALKWFYGTGGERTNDAVRNEPLAPCEVWICKNRWHPCLCRGVISNNKLLLQLLQDLDMAIYWHYCRRSIYLCISICMSVCLCVSVLLCLSLSAGYREVNGGIQQTSTLYRCLSAVRW